MERKIIIRLLAILLPFFIGLPGPVFALRSETTEGAGLEQLTKALQEDDPVGTVRTVARRFAQIVVPPSVKTPLTPPRAAAGLEEKLLEYLQKSLGLWSDSRGISQIQIPGGLGEAGREKSDETYARYWGEVRQNLRQNRQTISANQWRVQSREVFIQILRKHLAVSARESARAVRPSWQLDQAVGSNFQEDMKLLALGPLALFAVFFDQKGFVQEAYSIPGYFYELHIHDQGGNFWLGRGVLPFAFALRGTLHGEMDSPEGFIRLDPPLHPELFLKERLGTDSVPAEVQDRYPEILAEEVVNILTYLSEGGVHPDKSVVLLKEVREAIGRRYGVDIPERWTLRQFLSVIQRHNLAPMSIPPSGITELPQVEATASLLPQPTEGQVIRSVRVADPQGLHLKTANQIVRLLEGVSPETKITIREGELSANARKILDLLQLAVGFGETVHILGEGPQAKEAVEALARFLTQPPESEAVPSPPKGAVAPPSAGLEEKPIALASQSGLPITLDPKSWTLEFGGGIPAVAPAVRRIEALREVAQDPHRVINHASQVAYWMYRNVYDPANISAIVGNQLRYDITILAPSDAEHRLGQELVKTYGHYHPPRDPLPYPEVYEVLYGEAWFLLQRPNPHNPAVIEDVLLVKAHSGEKVIMLPDYGHITINPSRTNPLVMANWVSSAFDSQYTKYQQYRGAAYYVTWSDAGGVEFLPNRAYEFVPPIRKMRPVAELPGVGLKAGEPMYPLIKEPEKLSFLNEPERFLNLFSDALVPITSREQLQVLGELLREVGITQFYWEPAIQEDPALWRQAVRHIPTLLRQNLGAFNLVLKREGIVQVGWGLEMRPTGTGAAQLVAVEADSVQPYEVYAGFAEFLRQRAREAGATTLWLNGEGAFYRSPSAPQSGRLDGVFLPEGLWEFIQDRRLTLFLPIPTDPQANWRQIHWLLDPRTLRHNIPVEAGVAGVSVPIRGPAGFPLGSLRGYIGEVARDPETARFVPSHFIVYLTAGLEEREVAVVRELAVVALGKVFPPSALAESQVLVFTDPETFDLVPLAVRWGRTAAVDYDGPEADAVQSLLNKLPLPKGAYAIGTRATEMLLKESENPVWIASREDALRRLGLNPDNLPPVVREAIEITRDYLGVFV